ncbi:MAG: hypothetical protein ACI9OB_000143, partial [Nonlabens sp.]
MTYEKRRDLAQAELDGWLDEAGLASLRADEAGWVEVLEALLRTADTSLAHVRATVHGPERRIVLADFGDDRDRIAGRLVSLKTDGTLPVVARTTPNNK